MRDVPSRWPFRVSTGYWPSVFCSRALASCAEYTFPALADPLSFSFCDSASPSLPKVFLRDTHGRDSKLRTVHSFATSPRILDKLNSKPVWPGRPAMMVFFRDVWLQSLQILLVGKSWHNQSNNIATWCALRWILCYNTRLGLDCFNDLSQLIHVDTVVVFFHFIGPSLCLIGIQSEDPSFNIGLRGRNAGHDVGTITPSTDQHCHLTRHCG